MNDDEVLAFLERPLVAVISTVSADGTTHGVPVWYRYDGSAFSIWTDRSRRWVRNLEQRAEVAIFLAEHQPPFAAVIARAGLAP